ncbi:MAG TPA: NAD(P)-dependent oxidoreductase [Elusimicrobiota bacterium]|nr:NAD(P)-dependent oxidoreductase [Elusimicrobiota bacterium]
MKIIVFGGSGFLGSHVMNALSEEGHQVTNYDLKPSPYPSKSRTIIGDILDEKRVLAAMKGQRVAYNFAGYADIETAREKPLETIRANVLGNGILLESARKCGLSRFVFASTVYVYSQAGSFYRASKQACESYIHDYQSVYGLPYTILRYGSLYGPRSGEQNGLFRLLKQAVDSGAIVYWGDGEELREYIHVEDAAQCSVKILDKAYENECLTITGHHSIKVRDLLVMINEILGHKIKISYRPGSRPGVTGTHYKVTPYSFMPKEGRKLMLNHYVDMGQGLLSLAGELYSSKSKGLS